MLINLDKNLSQKRIQLLTQNLASIGVSVLTVNHLDDHDQLGLSRPLTDEESRWVEDQDGVNSLQTNKAPYKRASREMKPADTVIDVNGVKIGGGHFTYIGGPCSIENEKQLDQIAGEIKDAGAQMLRGGAFKPRTSPYSFQGLGEEGAVDMVKIGRKYGLPTVSEVMSVKQIDALEGVDVLQVGARNSQNFELLKELGKLNKPILLKRGFSNTMDELLMSAEYIMAGGNSQVILCERGIRTFEAQTRSTLDISAVTVLHQLSHLPVIIDPSHAAGKREYVESLSLAAVAAGADGLIIETHYDPENAWSDGRQCITPNTFADIVQKGNAIRQALGLEADDEASSPVKSRPQLVAAQGERR